MSMTIIEPHCHMISRTTDDYTRMYQSGIRCVVEPAFWQGANRRYAGSFFDYFALSLDFEHTRARRYGLDHWSCIAVNPKEADDLPLALETLAGIEPYLDHPRCVCVGEIGFNRITPNEERVFQAQLELAKKHALPVLIHTHGCVVIALPQNTVGGVVPDFPGLVSFIEAVAFLCRFIQVKVVFPQEHSHFIHGVIPENDDRITINPLPDKRVFLLCRGFIRTGLTV